MAEETPLMRQYWSIKNQHLDKILLFRMGDFYEMFFDDAVTAAPILGIALTSRNKKSADETPMCGVPHHSIGTPINKLLASGLKVALCEQVEDPKLAKGIVKRAVTRVMTPGMVYDPDTLDQTKPCFMAAFDEASVACVDTTTGQSLVWDNLSAVQVKDLIHHLPIAELVVTEKSNEYSGLTQTVWTDSPETPIPELPLHHPLQRLFSYIVSSGLAVSADSIKAFQRQSLKGCLELTPVTLRHLEIFESSLRTDEGSLFKAINRTQTAMGARRLRHRLAFPLREKNEIEKRLDSVQTWMQRLTDLKQIRSLLSGVGDLERRILKIGLPTCNARDVLALQASVASAFQVSGEDRFSELAELSEKIGRTLREDPPLSLRQGYLIQTGVDPDLDEAIKFSTQGQELLAAFEERQKSLSGISSLKVRYNQVFGYYIEVTNTHKEKVPSHFLRKQTLANAERYTTDELIELERKIISADVKRTELEFHLFDQLRKEILAKTRQILELASVVADIDVSTGLAWMAVERNYVRPVFNLDRALNLKNARHPVVEQGSKIFVANDIRLEADETLLLTGPNMAGKSTLMRQVALISILAQAGSMVPAVQAELPIYDSILTRIGASDSLMEGLSTFMVEMTETSQILSKATGHSLILLDEIGRGTSTYDGLSLAQAILEHLAVKTKSHVLFATHYHELTKVSEKLPQVKNAHMSIRESRETGIQFLYSLKMGPALKSYGIQVARLAKLPVGVTDRATQILQSLERGQMRIETKTKEQMAFWDQGLSHPIDPILQEMHDLDLNQMTPVAALVKLEKWKSSLKLKT